jgi:hypothetical protein
VEFGDGRVLEFGAGQGFLRARNAWHRGRNLTGQPVRFSFIVFFLDHRADAGVQAAVASEAGHALFRRAFPEPTMADENLLPSPA